MTKIASNGSPNELTMKKLLLNLISILSVYSCFATHSIAGYISYQHLRGTTYGVNVVIFQDANSPAIERRELEINWGDNSGVDSVNLLFQSAVDSSGTLLKRTFVGNHTYQSPGSFTVSVEDPNRSSGFNNLPNSVNIPLYLETILFISPIQQSSTINNSAFPKSSLVQNVELGQPVTFNLASFDEDKDFLTYHLVSVKGVGGQDAPGYSSPNDVKVDFLNGEFTWTNPSNMGLHIFSVKITECRNGVFIAETIVDFVINVVSSNSNIELVNLSPADTNISGNISYTIAPRDSVEAKFRLKSTGNNSTEGRFVLFGESNQGMLSDSIISPTEKEYTLRWNSDTSDLRCAPYLFVLRGTNGTVEKDISILVNVRDSSKLNCDTLCGYNIISVPEYTSDFLNYKVYPNPSSFFTFNFSDTPPQKIDFQLYNITGKLVMSKVILTPQEFVIRKENLESGAYIYRIVSENGWVKRGKLIFN